METTGKRLRIAVLNRVFSPTAGGAERYSMALVEQLAQRHEIHVFAQRIEHHRCGVIYHRVSSPLSRSRWLNQLWYATATWWATRRGFDVVHSHENTWHGQVQTVHVLPVKFNLFHHRAGFRRALRWLKVLTSARLLAYLWLERLRFSRSGSRCFVLASEGLSAQMIEAYPDTASALRVVTPGVIMVNGRATREQQFAARQGLGLPASGHGILFVGNDYRKKGLDALISGLALLRDDTWLAVVGNTSKKAEFRQLAINAGVEGRIYFLGTLKEVNDAYVACDCLAHPSLEDTFAMVVLEAMAHGLPVVVSGARYCGISRLLIDETDALILSQPRDSNALASALRRVLQEPSLNRALSERGLAFAARHLWSDSALQQETIYFSVLERSA